jgi:hypothetical protein
VQGRGEIIMNKCSRAMIVTTIILSIALLIPLSKALADSCYDLWYERNLIYAQNGYCFKTSLAKRTFGNDACRTSKPEFALAEQRRINQIILEERRLGCKVNQ